MADTKGEKDQGEFARVGGGGEPLGVAEDEAVFAGAESEGCGERFLLVHARPRVAEDFGVVEKERRGLVGRIRERFGVEVGGSVAIRMDRENGFGAGGPMKARKEGFGDRAFFGFPAGDGGEAGEGGVRGVGERRDGGGI